MLHSVYNNYVPRLNSVFDMAGLLYVIISWVGVGFTISGGAFE